MSELEVDMSRLQKVGLSRKLKFEVVTYVAFEARFAKSENIKSKGKRSPGLCSLES